MNKNKLIIVVSVLMSLIISTVSLLLKVKGIEWGLSKSSIDTITSILLSIGLIILSRGFYYLKLELPKKYKYLETYTDRIRKLFIIGAAFSVLGMFL